MGFRNSKESLSNLQEAASAVTGSVANSTVESTRNPQGRLGWAKSRSNGRSKSPINVLFGPATFGSSSAVVGRSQLLGEHSSSMTGTPNAVRHEDEAATRHGIHTGTATSSGLYHPNPPLLRRGLPSAPVVGHY